MRYNMINKIEEKGIELTDEQRDELDEIVKGSDDHMNIYTSFKLEEDGSVELRFEGDEDDFTQGIGWDFDEWVVSGASTIEDHYETVELVEDAEIEKDFCTLIGTYKFKLK